jgi:hypothetical protein
MDSHFLDRAPYPAEWALSRIVSLPEDPHHQRWDEAHWIDQRTRLRHQHRLDYDLTVANVEVWSSIKECAEVPQVYHSLFHRTKAFTVAVQDLAAATMKHEPSRWTEAVCYVIDYSVVVLRSESIRLERFLHSQRESLYWILDDALLRLCLDRWEARQARPSWDKAIEAVTLALSNASKKLPEWIERDMQVLLSSGFATGRSADDLAEIYFVRTQKFLCESTRVYEIWRTVRLSGIRQLPVEVADVIIDDVFSFENLPRGDLRSSYLGKGKGKT